MRELGLVDHLQKHTAGTHDARLTFRHSQRSVSRQLAGRQFCANGFDVARVDQNIGRRHIHGRHGKRDQHTGDAAENGRDKQKLARSLDHVDCRIRVDQRTPAIVIGAIHIRRFSRAICGGRRFRQWLRAFRDRLGRGLVLNQFLPAPLARDKLAVELGFDGRKTLLQGGEFFLGQPLGAQIVGAAEFLALLFRSGWSPWGVWGGVWADAGEVGVRLKPAGASENERRGFPLSSL